LSRSYNTRSEFDPVNPITSIARQHFRTAGRRHRVHADTATLTRQFGTRVYDPQQVDRGQNSREFTPPSQLLFFGLLRLAEPRSGAVRSCTRRHQPAIFCGVDSPRVP